MREKIENLLKKNCRYLEINVKNGDNYSIYKPNQEGSGNEFEILDDDFIKWTQYIDDGCTYENYFKIAEITFVTGLYNCPSLLEDEEVIEEEVDGNA